MSELLGKETIKLDSYNHIYGTKGQMSKGTQEHGRDLLTPDEVRRLDNDYALLFIRGELPVRDLKYNILKHPYLALTADGRAPEYRHGEADKAKNTIELSSEVLPSFDEGETEDNYMLLSEEDIEKEYLQEGGDQNEKL